MLEDHINEIVHKAFSQQTFPVCMKLDESSKMFCESLSNEKQIEIIKKITEGLLFKLTLCIINLEFLWKVSKKKKGFPPIYYEKKEWNNTNSIIDSTFFESSITQIRAFMDFAMNLATISIGITSPINGTKDFYKKLEKIDSKKSIKIQSIFKEMDENWGNDIRSIRDKILHYNIIKTNHQFRPTIQGLNYEKFIQKYNDYVFEFLIELSQTVFEVEWVSGTFEEFKVKYNR